MLHIMSNLPSYLSITMQLSYHFIQYNYQCFPFSVGKNTPIAYTISGICSDSPPHCPYSLLYTRYQGRNWRSSCLTKIPIRMTSWAGEKLGWFWFQVKQEIET